MKPRSLGLSLCLLLACEEPKAAPRPDPKASTSSHAVQTEAPSQTPENGRASAPEASKTHQKASEEPARPDRGKARFANGPKAPARACVVSERRKLDLGTSKSALALHGNELYVWFSRRSEKGPELVRMRVDDLVVDMTATLSSPLSTPPVVHADARDAAHVVTLSDDAVLSLTRFEKGKNPSTQTLARGVDRRFLPAQVRSGALSSVAYTHAVDEGMHVSIARVEGDKVSTTDVTPVSHGACAPTFVLGAEPRTLVMIDARAGVSPLLEIPFDQALKPGPAIVRTPVSQPYSPTELWAVQLEGTGVFVAYTAVGKAAATAIGLVPLREAKGPVPLLPSRGYGTLHFAAALGTRAAVFALTSPREANANGPLAIEVVVLDALGEGPRVTLEGLSRGGAPSLVSFAEEGFFALLYEGEGGGELVWLRCDA